MRNNDNIVFIDAKGVSHNARVQSFREHRDDKGKIVHDEPLVTLNYNAPPTGEPTTLIDVPHIDHPSRQENNPDLPSYPLHAWKYEDKDHLEVPADHPLHDHFNEQPVKDDQGNVIPKKRPIYESHIATHRQSKGASKWGQFIMDPNMGPNPGSVRLYINPQAPPDSAVQMVDTKHFPVSARNEAPGSGSGRYETSRPDVMNGVLPGHPAHPDTVHFEFNCVSCGEKVQRVASHQGGKQWEQFVSGLGPSSSPPDGGTMPGTWVEHVCNPETAKAYAESLKPKPAAVAELTPAEKLAAGWTPPTPETETVTAEPGVIAQLEEDMKHQPAPERQGDEQQG